MNLRGPLALSVVAPIALFGGLALLGLKLPAVQFGRSYVIRVELPDAGAPVGLPPVEGPQDDTRPLVVIDAGHGGHDPGASGETMKEKDLVLALARDLRDRLLEKGGIRVAMTRADDRFLALQERSDIARRLQADLFLSIHADSTGGDISATGASVYTLSEKASDTEAARIAARENNADRINGVSLDGRSDAVNAILVDLSQRRMREDSIEFANLITREGQGKLLFRRDPQRSAAFVVLKSPDVPSVLFEAGYISNAKDAQVLGSPEGRARFADAMDKAIRVYFARQRRD